MVTLHQNVLKTFPSLSKHTRHKINWRLHKICPLRRAPNKPIPSNTGKQFLNEVLSSPTDNSTTYENVILTKPSYIAKTKKFRSNKPNTYLLITAIIS